MATKDERDGAFAATTPVAVGGRTPGPGAPHLAEGTLLAARWRIVRFIAEGGMGQVYEADDQSLRERVALKILSPAVADDPVRLERFRREIQLARRVTHANVCRIFDMGAHEGLTFLTMELVRGETLAQRLRTGGPMSTTDALPLVEQLGAALAAAHAAGVVHRDFKSPNVLLDGARVVVTDFGLARSQEGDAALTQGGNLLGTPAYMAPEQVVGGAIGPAADVYALGVVLYEMVTGALPFDGDTPMAVAARRLDAKPPSPRLRVPGLDARWERTILRCLARDPAARPRVDEVVAALHGAPRRGSGMRIVAVAAVVVALGAGGWLLAGRGKGSARTGAAPAALAADAGPPAGTPDRSGRRSLAILGFKNLGGQADADWMSPALVELLTVELSGGAGVRLVAGEAIGRAKLDLALADAPTYAADTLARVHAHLGADWILVGSFLPQGGQIDLVLHVQDAATGELTADVRVRGADTDLAALAHQGAEAVRGKLGASGAHTLAALPKNPEVVRRYSEGVERLRLDDAQGARDLLKTAVELAPDFAMGHYNLARAWDALGYDPEAQVAAARAYDLSGGLPRDEKLRIEAQYHHSRFEWQAEIDLLRALFDFYPDDVEIGMQLAEALGQEGRPEERKATTARLRALAPDDPRVEMLGITGEEPPEELLAALERIEPHARARSSRSLLARILTWEAEVYWFKGDATRAQGKFDEGKRIFTELHDELGLADTLMQEERRLLQNGDLAAAMTLTRQAQEITRRIGAEHQESNLLSDEAQILVQRDELDEARRLAQQSLAIRKRLCRRWCEALSHVELAGIDVEQGRLDDADVHLATALQQFEKFENTDAIARVHLMQARILVERGRAREALPLIDAAEAKLPPGAIDGRGVRAWALARLGDTAGARKQLEAAAVFIRARHVYVAELGLRIELAHLARDRAALAALAKEADAKGLRNLARHARERR